MVCLGLVSREPSFILRQSARSRRVIQILEGNEAIEIFKKRNQQESIELENAVAEIIQAVRKEGDAALCRFSLKFDGCHLDSAQIRVSAQEIENARSKVEPEFLQAIRKAADNIRAYHQKQLTKSWFDCDREGVVLGQLVRPLQRVGIYVPGGKASYPSSVLMNAIPALVAGVEQVAMVTPPGKDGNINPHTLAAAAELGITEIYRTGGAQAVAALAYGTESIPKVDKITGPGNRFVTMAKRLVFGVVDIDMLAGPSEILVIADSAVNPVFVAADMLSQAEHDEMAAAILITPDREIARLVSVELESQLKGLDRSAIAAKSLSSYGAIIITGSIEEAIDMANRIAPEHLELMIQDPFGWLSKIKNAGAVFLGPYTPEPVGDYMAGPNHVLPTGGTARFFSPLGVDQFVHRTSLLYYSRDALNREAPDIIKLASLEGLDAHAKSVEVRLKKTVSESNKEVYDKGDDISLKPFDIIQQYDIRPDSEMRQGSIELESPPGPPSFADRSFDKNAVEFGAFEPIGGERTKP